MIAHHNKNRKERKVKEKDVVYQKDVTARNKLQPKYKKRIVKLDLGNKIKINNNRVVHKDNLKY